MTKHTLMQLNDVRLVAVNDAETRLERRRFWGLWWQRVKRLPLKVGRGLTLNEAKAQKTTRGGWDAMMVWTEPGDLHFMGEASVLAPGSLTLIRPT